MVTGRLSDGVRALRRVGRKALGGILFNSSRHYLREVNRAAAEALPAGSLVLDAGAGDGIYRDLFAHARYESADFAAVDKPYADLTYVCDLRAIPVEEARFDFVLFNQTMEHLPEPKEVLRELHRVLKPGGRLLYTGPLYYEEHEQPYDFYRYTQFGVRYLLEQAGFHVERVDWLEGYFGTLGYQLQRASENLPLAPRDYGGGLVGVAMAPSAAALKLSFGLLSAAFYRLDRRAKFTAAGHPKNYCAQATKR